MSLEEISDSENVEKGWFNEVRDRIQEANQGVTPKNVHDTYYLGGGAYGATGDGSTDDSQAFSDAISDASGGGTLVFLAPTTSYAITEQTLESDMRVIWQPGSKVVPHTDANDSNALFRTEDASNITWAAEGAVFDRERPTADQFGHVVEWKGCTNIDMIGGTYRGGGGDGVYISTTANQAYCEQMRLEGVEVDNARRNGISVISARDLLISNAYIHDTKGTAPEAGIDFEPNNDDEYLENIRVENLRTQDNASESILFLLNALTGGTPQREVSIQVDGLLSISDNNGPSVTCEGTLPGQVVLNQPRIVDADGQGFTVNNLAIDGPTVRVNGPEVRNPNTSGSTSTITGSAFVIYRPSGGATGFTMGGAEIHEPEVHDPNNNLNSNWLFVGNQENAETLEDISVIDPILPYTSPGSTDGRAAWANVKESQIRDRHRDMLLDLDADINIQTDPYRPLVANSNWTANRTVNLGSGLLANSARVRFEDRNDSGKRMRISPASGERIEPFATTDGQDVVSQERGAIVVLEKIESGVWYAVEKVGSWEAEL